MWRLTAALLALIASGCAPDAFLLAIDLKTDFAPGIEFIGVVVEVEDAPRVESVALPERSYVEGSRVATLSLPPGELLVTVRLIDATGAELAMRPVRVDLRESTALTVVIARSCRAVVCNEGQACDAGQCVDPSCTPETPELCGEAECAAAGECAAMSACIVARCDRGTCLYEDSGSCGAGSYCDAQRGCLARPIPMPPPLPASCAEILARDPNAASGPHRVRGPGGEVDVECEMDLLGGGWTRVADVDPSSGSCPGEWLLRDAGGVAICGRVGGEAQAWAAFESPIGPYREVMGYVRGVQYGSMDGFGEALRTSPRGGLSTDYVDGVSIVALEASPVHVWTYAVAWSDTDNSEMSVCPCAGGTPPPAFVGGDYYCESGHAGYPEDRWVSEDPLWDGDGAGSDCDTPADPSRFHRTLDAPLSAPLVVRVLVDQPPDNEDAGVTRMQLFVR